MILVLTGPVHSGKTSLLKNLVKELKRRGVRADGFLSLVALKKGETARYDLFDLKTEKAIPFLRKTGKKTWSKIGPYFIIPRALNRAKQKILGCDRKNFLIVDEVGPLEIRGEGLWPALSLALKKPSLGLLLVARHSVLPDVLALIGPNRVSIVDINQNRSLSSLLRTIIDWTRNSRETRERTQKEAPRPCT
ncbi:MAG: nucleoside-triphosphatase [Clostridiales bacterium]|jgi:nucleoside-triphosphatase THEP1|nr:nucleoside-triphosphatase [Clostridiales bacterium]